MLNAYKCSGACNFTLASTYIPLPGKRSAKSDLQRPVLRSNRPLAGCLLDASSSHLIMASTSGTSTSGKVQARTVLYCDGKPLLEVLVGIVISLPSPPCSLLVPTRVLRVLQQELQVSLPTAFCTSSDQPELIHSFLSPSAFAALLRCKSWLQRAHPALYAKYYSDSECPSATLQHRSAVADLLLTAQQLRSRTRSPT